MYRSTLIRVRTYSEEERNNCSNLFGNKRGEKIESHLIDLNRFVATLMMQPERKAILIFSLVQRGILALKGSRVSVISTSCTVGMSRRHSIIQQ